MRKLYSTLLLLMAAILAMPSARASATVVSLPWTPQLGMLGAGAQIDFQNYYNLWRPNTNSQAWNWYSSNLRLTRPSNNSRTNDAMLFLPPMILEEGVLYHITFSAYHDYNDSGANGKLTLYCSDLGADWEQKAATSTANNYDFGKDPEIKTLVQAGLKIAEIDPTLCKNMVEYTPGQYEYYFKAPKSGMQRIVFHGEGNRAYGAIYLYRPNDFLSVSQSHETLPAAPTDLTATPDPSGKKEVTVSFKAPSKTVLGEDITEMTFINVMVNGALNQRIDNPVPGQEYTLTLKSAQAVPAEITVVGGNTHGTGIAASISTTIGTAPKAPTYRPDHRFVEHGCDWPHMDREVWHHHNDAQAIYADGKITITWTDFYAAAEGETTYTVKRLSDGKVIAENTTALSCVDEDVNPTDAANYQYNILVNGEQYIENVYHPEGIYSNVVGMKNTVPYSLTFMNQESANEVYLKDYDNQPLIYDKNYNALVTGWSDAVGDEAWFNALELEAGKFYKVTAKTGIGNYDGPENFEFSLGRSNTAESCNLLILPQYVEKHDLNSGGAEHTGFFSVPENGQYFPYMHVWSDKGGEVEASYLYSLRIEEVDAMLPNAVENLTVTFDPQQPTKAKLLFNAPTKGVGGADLTEITNIIVLKDDVEIGRLENPTPGAAQEFDIEARIGEQIVYKVYSTLNGIEGVATELPVQVLVAPYSNNFKNNLNIVGWTIEDLGKDGFTWNTRNGFLRCYATNGNDDWIITPPVSLKGGYFYKISYSVGLESALSYDNTESSLGMFMGREATVEAMTQQVVETYFPQGSAYGGAALLKDYLYIPEDGIYYFGWHAVGPETIGFMDLEISDVIECGVPDLAPELTITPDKMGAMKGEISFMTPGKTLKGDPLYGNIDYVVYRDGVAVYTTTSTPNKRVTFTDTGMTEGVHLYSVIPANSYGTGREKEDVAYFGVNRPYVPENFSVRETDTYGTVLLTWDAPSRDYDGFPINPDLITYEIFQYVMPVYADENPYEVQIATGIRDLNYTHVAKSPTANQEFLRYGIRAYTTKGGSPGLLGTYINVGSPYEMPVKESFENMHPTMAMMQSASGMAAWGYNSVIGGVKAVDGDNGMAIMEAAFVDGSSRLFTGKIHVSGETPYLSLYLYNHVSAGEDINEFTVEVGSPAGWTPIATNTVNGWCSGNQGWQKVRIDLSEYKDQTLQFSFNAQCKRYTYTLMDAVVFGTEGTDDLSIVGADLPARVNPGQDFTVKANVRNSGLRDADVYTVRLFRGSELLESQNGVALQPGETHTFTFAQNLVWDEANPEAAYTLDVRYAPDADNSDNRLEGLKVSVRAADFMPTVENLQATKENVNEVTLNWEAPVLQTEPVEITDDFESYESWTGVTGFIGDYTNLDEDKIGVTSLQPLDGMPCGYGTEQGWIIMDMNNSLIQALNDTGYNYLDAHSGSKAIVAAGLYDRSENVYANDWLISPELTGEAQTVSFWTRSCHPQYPDRFVFLTSSTDAKVGSFTEIEADNSTVSPVPTEWTQYTYELPAGTKYFAIQHQITGGLYQIVDDLTFTPAGAERLEINGYRIYKEGQFVQDMAKNATSYKETALADGTHKWGVSVKYNLGESQMEETSVAVSGVTDVYNDGPQAQGQKGGILVAGAEGMTVSVWDTAGVNLYITEGNGLIPMAPGVYVVKIGTADFKVYVK